jgi:hypothetical protein
MHVVQALQLESGQNIELRDDLTALSAELHRLQTEQATQQQAQTCAPSPPQPASLLAVERPVSFPAAEDAPTDAQALSAAQEEAQQLRQVRACCFPKTACQYSHFRFRSRSAVGRLVYQCGRMRQEVETLTRQLEEASAAATREHDMATEAAAKSRADMKVCLW